MFASAAPILMTDDMNALSSEEQADLVCAYIMMQEASELSLILSVLIFSLMDFLLF